MFESQRIEAIKKLKNSPKDQNKPVENLERQEQQEEDGDLW